MDNNELTVTLTVKEMQTIVDALSDKPFKEVNEILHKIISQSKAQLSPPEPAADAPVVDAEPV